MEADFGSKIEAARKAGYSDDEIVQHLSAGELGSKIKTATDAGYSSKDILDHLGGSSSGTEAAPAPPSDEGVMGRLKRGADTVLEGLGTTAQAVAPAGSELSRVGGVLRDAIDTPTTPSDTQQFIHPATPDKAGLGGFDYSKLPGAMVEQAPQVAANLGARGVGAGVGFLAGGPIGAAAGGAIAPAVVDFVQTVGPNAIARAKANGRDTPEWDDWLAAGGTSAAQGALAALGIGGKLGAFTTAAKEGVTNYLGNLLQQYGTTAGTKQGAPEFPEASHEALGQAIASTGPAALAGTAAKAKRGLQKLATDERPAEVQAADRRVANRIKEEADQIGLDLKDTESNQYQNEAAIARKNAQVKTAQRIKTLAAMLKPKLSEIDANDLDSILERSDVFATLRDALNERKNITSESDINLVKSKVGHYAEGRELVDLLHDSNSLTRLSLKGVKGKRTRDAEQYNPLTGQNVWGLVAGTLGHAGATALGVPPLAALGTYAPLALQTARYLKGVVPDAITGERYPINRFVKKNAGPEPRRPAEPTFAGELALQKMKAQDLAQQGQQAGDEVKALRSDTFRALYDKATAGTLTPEELDANASNLTDAHYKLFKDNLKRKADKEDADALKRDRAVVRQGEIMGKQRQAEEQANLKDLTTGMRMTARGRAQASAQEQAQVAAAERQSQQEAALQARQDRQDAAAQRRDDRAQEKQSQQDLLKEGTDLANSGKLTDEWLASNRDRLTAAQYAQFAGKVARQKEKLQKAAEATKAPKERPSVGKAPRAPKVAQPPEITLTTPRGPQPSQEPLPKRTYANGGEVADIVHPEAYQSKVYAAEGIREQALKEANLMDGETHDAVVGAIHALDSLPDMPNSRDRRNWAKRKEVTDAIRDSLSTAEKQMTFERAIRDYRDFFKKTSTEDVIKKVRAHQGLDDLPDVPF